MERKQPIRTRRKRRKSCVFCVDEDAVIDYKDVYRLKRYTTERGKIDAQRNTNLCAKHQRKVAKIIKRSRSIGLLPFVINA